jgi:uncharacterized membrane protein YqhA
LTALEGIRKILEKSKYVILLAVLASVLAAVAAFALGAYKAVSAIFTLVFSLGSDPLATVAFIELMDTLLIATALLIFGVGLYELFFEDVRFPEWLVVRTIHDLKVKLASVIVLVLAVTFLKHLVEWKDPVGTLYFAIATAVVSAVLIAFVYLGEKH